MFTTVQSFMYLLMIILNADFVFDGHGIQFVVNLKETLVNENGRRVGSVRRLNSLSIAKLCCQ